MRTTHSTDACGAPFSLPLIPPARSAVSLAIIAAMAARPWTSASLAGAPWKPSGYSSAMKPVVSRPSRKRGCCISADTKSMLCPGPSISNRSSAAIWASIAASRVGPQVTSFAIIGS